MHNTDWNQNKHLKMLKQTETFGKIKWSNEIVEEPRASTTKKRFSLCPR